MSVSVLVVAHNEEETIGACLESLQAQEHQPDEVVVICHNSTDRTEAIARTYPVTVVPYEGPAGSIFARMRGFEIVGGDIVACIDADAVANSTWLSGLIEALSRPGVSIAGSVVLIHGTLVMWGASIRTYFLFYPLFRMFGVPRFYDVWGAGFAIRMSDYRAIGGLDPLLTLHKELQFRPMYWPDDFYLTYKLSQKGTVRVSYRSCVSVQGKEKSEYAALTRALHNQRMARSMLAWFRKHP